MSLDDTLDEMQHDQEARGSGRRGFKRPSLGRKGKGSPPRVRQAVQHEVARPKRQVHPVVKRTYGSLHTLLRVLQPVNAILVLGIMIAVITKLHGWYLFSFAGVGVGLGLVIVELVLFSQVWKHYQLATPEQAKHLLIMGFFALLMLGTAGAAVYRWQDHRWSMLLVLAVVVASVDPMEVANVNAEKRSIRAEIEAENAAKTEAAETNLRNTSIILQQVNELVPGINAASDQANNAMGNATSLIGVLGDQEKAITRRVDAQVAVEKSALIAQIRGEEQAKARTWAQDEVNRVSEELKEQYAAQYGQPQPAARPTSHPAGGLPGYPGASTHSVPASQDTVSGEVTSH